MNLARKLRQRLAQMIATDSRVGNGQSDPTVSAARNSNERGSAGRVSANRGGLKLERLEGRQMMAGDVELLFTDPTDTVVDITSFSDEAVQSSSDSDSTGRGIGGLTAEGENGINLVALAQHLADTGFEVFGADFCPACTAQKQLFEDGGNDLPYTDVTLDNAERSIDPQFASLNITEFPTWILPDNSRLIGVQSIETLIDLSNFQNPTDGNPLFEPIGAQTVAIGSPLHIPVDAYDAEGGPLTVTVSVADPSLLEASVITGNRSLRLDLVGYDDIVFELFEQRAPVAAGRVATLAESGFYDGIIFHRVVDDFVLQAGDPTGTGAGGSDLGQFDDDFNEDLQHNRSGVLSFAKSSDDTNNSQFFITEIPTRFLDFNHSVFGQLVEGEEVREAISEIAVDGSDRPINQVTIDNATVFDDTENSVVFLRPLAGTGTTNVTFTVTDSDGNEFQEIVPITIVEDNIDSQPFLTTISDPVVANGRTATLQLDSVDVEGDAVQYFVTGASANATANVDSATGLVTVTADEDFTGTVEFTVGVAAAVGAGSASDLQAVSFEFNQTEVTSPLSIDLRDSGDSGTSSSDNITNIGSLTFDLTGVTPGAFVELVDTSDNTVIGSGTAASSTISITTNNISAIGDGTFTLAARQVIDGTTGDLSPQITVQFDTTLPVFNTTSVSTSANIGVVYTTDLVSAEEGNGVVYSLDSFPVGATIVAGTGVINWTPTEAQLGTNDFTVSLTDAAGNVRTETFSVDVASEPTAGVRLELTDLDGNVIDSADVGQEFLLNFFGVDQRERLDRSGVFAAFADVLFDGSLVRAVPGSTIEFSNTFGVAQSGSVSTGLIDELGAASSLLTPTNEFESLIATVRLEALAAGTVNFVSEPADESGNDVLVFNSNDQVPATAVNYQSTTLAIGQTFTAVADTFSVAEDSTTTVLDVLANDTIIGGSGTLSVVSVSQPSEGGVVELLGGDVVFTPTTNFVGTAEFTYRVSGPDGVQEDVPVTVTVTGVNDPPVGVDDTFIVDSDSAANSFDVLANEASTADPGETLTVTAVSTTSAGATVAVASDGLSVNYTPPAAFVGTDTFTYTLSDGTSTDTVSVTVTVSPADNPPTAVADSFPASGDPAINEDAAQASYDVLANDLTDSDNQAFTIETLGTPSAGGTVSIGNNGGTLLYQPAANFNGTETVTYTIRDSGGGLATTTATFTVTSVNDPPPISDGVITLVRDSGQSTVLSISDLPANPDTGEAIQFVNLSTPTSSDGTAVGVASIASDGQSILFTPPTDDFTGDVTFEFEVEDASQLRSGPATMTITIVEFTRRAIDIELRNSASAAFLSSPSSFTITGTNVLNETISLPLNDSSVVVSESGIRVPNLLPGSYTINIPAIPFLQNGDEAQSISIESLAEDGDETVEIELGRLKAEYINVSDWFSSRPRLSVLAAVTAGGDTLFARASEVTGDLSDITVDLDDTGSVITVNAIRQNDGGTDESVTGSANINDDTVVDDRGSVGDLRLVLVSLEAVGGVALSTPAAGTASTSSTVAAAGEPLASTLSTNLASASLTTPLAAAAVSQNDVFVPGVNPDTNALTSRADSSLLAEGEPNLVLGNGSGPGTSASSVDAAMTEVAEELTVISSAEDAVANSNDQSVQTFTEFGRSGIDRPLGLMDSGRLEPNFRENRQNQGFFAGQQGCRFEATGITHAPHRTKTHSFSPRYSHLCTFKVSVTSLSGVAHDRSHPTQSPY